MAPVKYAITVRIESRTLDILRADPRKVLVLVRDIRLGDDIVNGNIVFATYGSRELSSTQTFIWEELYSISETTNEFRVGVFIFCLMHTIDDWHVARCRSHIGHGFGCHSARPDSRV